MPSFRPHHYAFGHVALRQAFLEDPRKVSEALTAGGEDFLKGFWNYVGTKVREQDGDAELLPSEGLALSTHDLGSRTSALVVTLPPPLETPEAYFVALVVRRPRPGPSFHIGRVEDPPRYLTLELGMDFATGERRTVLCEWTSKAHCNYGTGPAATVEAFVACVKDQIERS